MKFLSLVFGMSALFLLGSALKFLAAALDQTNTQAAYGFMGPGSCMLIAGTILALCSMASFKAS